MPIGVPLPFSDNALLIAARGVFQPSAIGAVLAAGVASALVTIPGSILAAGQDYANVFSAANTFRNPAGTVFQQAVTKDGICLLGGAGGSGSYNITFTPASLSGSRIQTFQDATGTIPLLQVAGTWSALQAFTAGTLINETAITGSLTFATIGANRLCMDAGRIMKTGPNTTTAGTLSLIVMSSDASVYSDALDIKPNGDIGTNSATDATSTTSASLTLVGGLAIGKALMGGSFARFTYNGNNGISVSTSSSTSFAEIQSRGDTGNFLGIGYSGSAFSGSPISGGFSGESAFIYTSAVKGISIGTNGVARLNLDTNGNIGIGVTAWGTSAVNVVGLKNATAPTTSPAGMGQLYVESGALKFRGSSGTVTVIAPA